jgi:hypothetical protein
MSSSPLPQPYVTTRQDVLKELVESEASFHKDLGFIVDYLLPGFAAAKNIDKKSSLCVSIFGNIEPIYQLSFKFLQALQREYTQINPQDPCVSTIIITLAKDFECFAQYVSNQPISVKQYQDTLDHDPRAADAMRVLFASNTARFRGHLELFALPYQRLCRYGLFLQRLIKLSAQHPEYDNLLRAETEMNRVVSQVNAMRGEQERRAKLEQVALLIEFTGTYPPFPINIPQREIIFHGPMTKIRTFFNRAFYFFIFNDIIVYTMEIKSLFRDKRYQVKGVIKVDEYLSIKSHDKSSNTKHWISIFQTIKHIPKHYDAQYAGNKKELLRAFDEVTTRFAVDFIQKKSKERIQEQKEKSRQLCSICPSILSQYGRNTCFNCKRDVCNDCFNCTVADRRMCIKCGEQFGVQNVDYRLIPAYRSYICVTGTNINTTLSTNINTTTTTTTTTTTAASTPTAANMISLNKDDQLQVYFTVNQRWGIGSNITQQTFGCFPIGNCKIDQLTDKGENQLFCSFAGFYSPQFLKGATNTFPKPLNVGDVIVITYDNNDGWYFGLSLQTKSFGYIHFSDLLIVRNTEIAKKKYQ